MDSGRGAVPVAGPAVERACEDGGVGAIVTSSMGGSGPSAAIAPHARHRPVPVTLVLPQRVQLMREQIDYRLELLGWQSIGLRLHVYKRRVALSAGSVRVLGVSRLVYRPCVADPT